MKRPIIDGYDREILKAHRLGFRSIAGALIELDVATLKLRREVCNLLLEIHLKIKGEK